MMNAAATRLETESASPMRKPAKNNDFVGLLVFLIPCVQFIQIKAIGQLDGSDLLLIVVFVYLAFRGKIQLTNRYQKWFVVLCCLWLVSQCVTDIVRHSAFLDYVRGWSNIGLTLLIFMALFTLLYGRPSLIVLYGWGYVVGAVLKYLVSPDDISASEPWKFGVGEAATLAVFLLISRKECRGHWPLTLSAAIGIVNFMLGYRSMGGVCLSVTLYLLVTRILRKRSRQVTSLTRGSIVMIACSILLGTAGVYWAYQYAANSGLLGEVARVKYEEQSSGEYGMLLGGRVEMLGYIPAIIDSPILGHGSWAKDPKYVLEQHQAMALMGYSAAEDYSENDIEEGYIPTHSCLFGAWVDAGILGALFWAWVFVLTAKALLRVYPGSVVLLPLMSFVAFSLLWDVLFSPFGFLGRIIMPYRVVFLMTCIGIVQPKIAMAAGLRKSKASPARDQTPR
jgi:hypothetical protein